MKKNRVFPFILLVLLPFARLSADEGMWIPLLLEKLNQGDMQRMGMRLTAEDIYSVNKSSLKDAIVLFGGGCTAEIVSDEGLIITNHHCGYRTIQSHSTVENDLLTKGFWAMDRKDELPNPGLSVSLLIRMEDVTAKVLEGILPGMTEAEREKAISKNIAGIEKIAVEETHYKAQVKPFYYGNEYYLFVFEVFTDIRLVGAPPSNIGKFGGDTDNWMWPRHTGDFSLFRIYVDKDNKPADYSPENVPYKPKNHLKISLKGVEKDDFTFIFGYPGSTDEYLTSHAVNLIANVSNPAKIALRDMRLKIMDEGISRSDQVRIQYAAKYASVANYWKKMIGESNGIKRLDGVEKKREIEAGFSVWANSSPKLKGNYGGLLPAFEKVYEQYTPVTLAFDYFVEAGHAIELVRFSYGFSSLVQQSKGQVNPEALKNFTEKLKNRVEGYFKNYNPEIDKKTFTTLLRMYYQKLDKAYHPAIFAEIDKKYKGDFEKYTEDVYAKSVFASKEKILKFLDSYTAPKWKKIEKDPAFRLASSIYGNYFQNILPAYSKFGSTLDSLYRVYMKGLIEMMPDKRFYPDANSTLRVAYGKVAPYKAKDAVTYQYFTTLEGIMEKEDPAIYDYVVESKLKGLYAAKNYGPYADKDGKMHVAFIATNHTTGGNSGSPVLDADGYLIGVNFDRCWEGTMSDLMYDPEMCRNITLDIRYALFIIDKFAGAPHLINEMTIIR